jgi:hypothetical protein
MMYELEEILEAMDQGFYSCKEFPKIIVSKTGVFVNSETTDTIPISYKEDFYPTFTYPGGDTVLVHRILAFMFVEKPTDFEDRLYVVNHKDGDKTNFAIENLEWVTPSRNSIHAYETGLRDDNTPIMAKDLRTEKVQRFYSLQECARHFKVNGFNIHWNLLPCNRGKVSFNYFVFIREGDVWPNIDEELIGKHRNGRPKPMVVTSVEESKAVIYDSAGSAARAFGIKPGTLVMKLLRNETVIIDGHMFKYLDDPDLLSKHEMLSIGRKTIPPRRSATPVKVENTETGEVLEYKSTEEFAKLVGVRKNTIQKRVLMTGGRWRNYLITYVRPLKE